jgi:hypothetical protein
MDPAPRSFLSFRRDTHLFASRPHLVEKLDQQSRHIPLSPNQLLHPEVPIACIVRLGKLRVSEFLPDGREVTRAVLQAGTVLITGMAAPDPGDAAADIYNLSDIVLMAMGEVELWALPPEALELL